LRDPGGKKKGGRIWFRLVTFSGIQATEELDDESSGGGIPLKF